MKKVNHKKCSMNRWLLALAFSATPVFLGLGCSPREQDRKLSDNPPVNASADLNGMAPDDPTEKLGNVDDIPTLERDETLDEVSRLAAAGKFESALPLLQQLLLIDPNDAAVLFQMGIMHAGCGELAEAIDCLAGIPENHPEAGIPALGQAADWCVQLQQFDRAIDRYERILRLDSTCRLQ